MTKEEILKEATKRTLNINEFSTTRCSKAMEEYAQQQVKNRFLLLLQPILNRNVDERKNGI